MLTIPALPDLVEYTTRIDEFKTPEDVLDNLHDIIVDVHSISVLGAGRLPPKFGDWSGVELGKNVFVHRDVPDGWWAEYISKGPKIGYDPGIMMSRFSLAPFTWTESSQSLEPTGQERWPYELALKYGMRDGFTCPIAARWIIAFWSRDVLTNRLSEPVRALLFMASSFAAIRLEELTARDAQMDSDVVQLTPREKSVLRMASLGRKTQDIANILELGVETVRSHFKKAQKKLGTGDKSHTIAEAIRHNIIP